MSPVNLTTAAQFPDSSSPTSRWCRCLRNRCPWPVRETRLPERLCHRCAAALLPVAVQRPEHPRRHRDKLYGFQSYSATIGRLRFGGHQPLRRRHQRRSRSVTGMITQTPSTNVVYDSNPDNPQHNGVDMGATWEASSSDRLRHPNGRDVFCGPIPTASRLPDNTAFDGTHGTITFWMRSAGTDQAMAATPARPFLPPRGRLARP
jgi:hypothetical protein